MALACCRNAAKVGACNESISINLEEQEVEQLEVARPMNPPSFQPGVQSRSPPVSPDAQRFPLNHSKQVEMVQNG
jgi:hypothetical protein